MADSQFTTPQPGVVTAAADILAWLPAPHAGALILTTAAAAQRLRGRLPVRDRRA